MTADSRNGVIYGVKRSTVANEAHFLGVFRNMGHFLCGVERVKHYVNVHLHCIVSSLQGTSKMSTLPAPGKISADANACVVYVYNLTCALYCALNNYFCVIREGFPLLQPLD